MERKRIGRDLQALGDFAGRHTVRSFFDEQTENTQAGTLRQRDQTFDGGVDLHDSMMVETIYRVNRYLNENKRSYGGRTFPCASHHYPSPFFRYSFSPNPTSNPAPNLR